MPVFKLLRMFSESPPWCNLWDKTAEFGLLKAVSAGASGEPSTGGRGSCPDDDRPPVKRGPSRASMVRCSVSPFLESDIAV